MKKLSNTKVIVGLSGGVDSSVSAALLKKQGYNVVGAFIKVWQPNFLPCNWPAERRDAIRVAAHLDIPFVTIDLAKEYKKGVVDYMISEYKAGRTPNPDVMCNKYVKFDAFLKQAKKMGADFVATGHYAQVQENKKSKKQEIKLLAGVDSEKDQSYFLWTLTQSQLKYIKFPVGGIKKSEVRSLAKKFKLPTANKKDSQGLCFVGKIEMKDFLSNYLKLKPGKIINTKGETVGQHDGAWYYTVGQRHGLTITRKKSGDKPYYVVKKDIKKNVLNVARRAKLMEGKSKIVKLDNINWIKDTPLVKKKYLGRVRYRQSLQSCTIKSISKKTVTLEFTQPQLVASGQSCVLYTGNTCIGGGIIK